MNQLTPGQILVIVNICIAGFMAGMSLQRSFHKRQEFPETSKAEFWTRIALWIIFGGVISAHAYIK